MPFSLSAIISGHKNDVRCVYPLSDGSNRIVSGSRDGSAKLWAPQPSDPGVAQQWHCITTFAGHRGFVSAVATRVPDEVHPNGLIYTGCQDGVIRAFDPCQTEPLQTMTGHSANVVSLFLSKANTLLSGSWDHSAKVWLNEREVMNLSGHSNGVWAGIILPETGIMVTGSADKSIRLWKAGKCKKILEHHTQSVRDLAVISSTEFLSCANDHQILMYKIMNEEGYDCEVVFRYEDIDYIYSLAVRNPPTSWVSCGEHIGLRVFDNGEISSFLSVPTSSVWSTCVLPNGDIAAACSDAKIYIFSRDPSRAAPEDIQAVFEAEVMRFTQMVTNGGTSSSESTLPAEVGGVKVDDIQGPEALNFPGKRDGMTKMIREGNTISVHSWSQATGEWTKVGDMVTDPDKSGQTSSVGKSMFEGKEYDYVFNIDIDDNASALKMPYNNDQDPYQVAQQFIYKHELPQSYLDEIAGFIFKNASNPGNVSNLGQYCDPFTGSGAYVSGSGGVPTAKDYASGAVGVASDPFTGSGAYVSGSGGVPTAKDYGSGQAGVAMDPFTGSGAYVSGSDDSSSNAVNTYFPMKSCLSFSQLPKMDALKSKIIEFNQQVTEDSRITEEEVVRLTELTATDKADQSDVALLLKVMRWPSSQVFPCLDIARLAFLNSNVCQCITAVDEIATDFLENIIGHVKDSSKPVNQMLALKVLANAFSSPSGSHLMVKLRSIVFSEITTFLPTDNKNVQVGLATILLNYSVIASQEGDSEAQVQCVNVSFLLLEGLSDPESKFRTLVALGTLLSSSEDARKAALELDLGTRIRTWKEVGGVAKIVECADFILKI